MKIRVVKVGRRRYGGTDVSGTATADADPLGVSMDIGFGSVGGLDGRESLD